MFADLNTSLLIQQFATIAAVVDPIGTVPVFIAVTTALPAARRRGVALRSVLIAGVVLMGFLVAGQPVLNAISVNLTSFQIAGGIVLFLFALTMIFGPSKTEAELAQVPKTDAEHAIFPLAIPSIASPGAMLAMVVLTDNNVYPVGAQMITAAITLSVLGLTFVLLLLASQIQKLIGPAGASVISRVMGLILAAIAVDNVIGAIIIRFGLSTSL